MKHFINFEAHARGVEFCIDKNTLNLADDDILFIHINDGTNRYLKISIGTEIDEKEITLGVKRGNDNIL